VSIQQRRERDRAQRHELIITTARELAEAEGWDAVTTRRLADRIEYSQPVLYSHFAGKDAIVSAVALRGIEELTSAMRAARAAAGTPDGVLAGVAHAYVDFADANPALYDAMFVLSTDLRFADESSPALLQAGFAELRAAFQPLADGRDLEVLTEVGWSALHGLVILNRAGRMRPEQQDERIDMLVRQLLSAARPA
jgi:AcrR family transcriptional regulator